MSMVLSGPTSPPSPTVPSADCANLSDVEDVVAIIVSPLSEPWINANPFARAQRRSAQSCSVKHYRELVAVDGMNIAAVVTAASAAGRRRHS